MMKQARPSEKDFDAVTEFMQGIEQIIEQGEMPNEDDEEIEANDSDVHEWIMQQWKQVGSSWRRVVFGGMTAISNACDETESALEWKPEIKAAIEMYEAAKAAKA